MEYFERQPVGLELHSVGIGEPLQVFKKRYNSTNARIIQENYKN